MVDIIENQKCVFCFKDTMTMTEEEIDIPYFGKTFVFGMSCGSCGVSKSDVEAAEDKDPVKVTFTTESEEDMKVRVVKSSEATVKIPTLRMSVDSGPASDGYVTNIEGLIHRFEKIVEDQRDNTDDKAVAKSAKNLLKKIRKVKWGEIPCKIVIMDPTGNSAIISEKAVIEKLKRKKK